VQRSLASGPDASAAGGQQLPSALSPSGAQQTPAVRSVISPNDVVLLDRIGHGLCVYICVYVCVCVCVCVYGRVFCFEVCTLWFLSLC